MRFTRYSLQWQLLLRVLPIFVAALLAPAMGWGQKFVQPTIASTPSFEPPWPTSLVGGALQAPGRTDLIVIYRGVANPSPGFPLNSDVGTGQFLNSGTGIFNFASQNSPEFTATSVVATIADLNGDGKQDVAFATSNAMTGFEDLCVDFGKGGGAVDFTQSGCTSLALVKTVQPQLTYIAAMPLKSGGLPQLILEDSANGYVYLVQNTGASNPTPGGLPSFTVKSRYAISTADGTGPIAVGDFNGDGNMDFMLNGQTGHSVSVYLGNGDGTFQPLQHYTFGSGVNSLLLQDMDSDGHLDMVIENSSGGIEIHHGIANGLFQVTSIGGTTGLNASTGGGGHLIGIADLNHDGILDILTATPAGISVLLGQGNFAYSIGGIYNAGPGHSSYVLQDFNGDGNLDLAVDSPEGVAILYGNPDGSFQTSRAFAAGLPAMSGALGAITSSGNWDAVVSTAATQAQWLKGNGDGSFTYAGSPGAASQTTPQTGTAGLFGTVQVGDFNGDSKLDLAITADGPNALTAPLPNGMVRQAGTVIQTGNGDGTFLTPVFPVVPLPNCTTVAGQLYGVSTLADLNGDGLADLINRSQTGARVYFGASGGVAMSGAYLDGNCNLHAHDIVLAGDFNNDGVPDLLVQTDSHLVIGLNQGKGLFGAGNTVPGFSTSLVPSATNDLSIDGALTTPGQLTAPALNSTFNGPAIPTSSGGLGFPAFIGSAVVADLDRDGNNDLIATYANLAADRTAPTSAAPNYIYIWYGSGGGKFLTSAKHPVNPVRFIPSRNFYQAAVADLDGDGIPDLILSDGYLLSVQLGKGDGTFGAETHYLAGQGLNTISVADVNHDGTLDLVIANGGTVWSNPVANLDQPSAAQDVNTGGITVLLNRAAAPVPTISGTVTATPEPSTYGGAFSITATITPSLTNITPPTGMFAFAVDGVVFGSGNITGASTTVVVPSFVYSTLAPGLHTLTAAYSGDSNWAASTLTGPHTVSLNPTSISLLLCVDPPGSNFPCGNPINQTPLISPITMYFGQSMDGVAIESATNLTGTITFFSGSSIFCTLNANLQQGTQSCPPASGYFPVGTTTVTAVYSGDSLNAGSTSNGIVVTVLPDPTTATVTSSLNPSNFGQPVTFTASVQGNFAVGAGPVIFLDGTTTLGTAILDATGHATLSISTLAVGTHPIKVAFPGSASFLSTTSGVLNQVVQSPISAVQSYLTLSSSINPSAPGQSVTFTASVSAPGPFPIIPTGTVNFLDGTTVIGTGTINPATGVATFTTTLLTTGSHPITATYAGMAATSVIEPNPPYLPKPPGAHLVPVAPSPHGFWLMGPAPHATVVQPPAINVAAISAATPSVAAVATPAPRVASSTPAILASTSAVLTQVVTASLGAEAPGFVLTVTPTPVTVGVGDTAILLVNVRAASGFSQPVALTCSALLPESTCTFIQPLIPIGGGSTTLQLIVSAPHTCGTTTPYFVGSAGEPAISGTVTAIAVPALFAGGFLFAGIRRRRRGPWVVLTVLAASLCGLAMISGCGNCTDLGTKPGSYTFTVVGTAQGGPSTEVEKQVIPVTVTIP